MSHYRITAALDGPTHATFVVEADSKQEAGMQVTSSDRTGEPQYNGHYKLEHVVSTEEISEEEAEALRTQTPYTVSGMYMDNYQSFSQHVMASSPKEAVRKTFSDLGEEAAMDLDFQEAPLSELAEATDMEPVSVVKGHHKQLVNEANPAW